MSPVAIITIRIHPLCQKKAYSQAISACLGQFRQFGASNKRDFLLNYAYSINKSRTKTAFVSI